MPPTPSPSTRRAACRAPTATSSSEGCNEDADNHHGARGRRLAGSLHAPGGTASHLRERRPPQHVAAHPQPERTSVSSGTTASVRVDLGGSRLRKHKNETSRDRPEITKNIENK